MHYKVSTYGLSDIGLVRQNNEDVWTQLPEESLFVLADGMGGHQAGEVAARLAVESLCAIFKEKIAASDRSLKQTKKILLEAIVQVNDIVYRMGHSYDNLKGMGTTLCCVLLHTDGLIYAHVGDSRIYRLHRNQLEQLTQDHSLLRELIEMGQLNEQQAGDFLYKNIITRAIGTESLVEPSVQAIPIYVGDVILMCTDGLSDLLSYEEIQQIVRQMPEQEIAQRLITAAKQKGGHDNITVVVIKVQEKYEQADLS